jgi:hypothetical protein
MHRSTRLAGAALVAALVGSGSFAVAEAAPVGFSVHIVAHTDFETVPNVFESNLDGCETGTVADGGGGAHFTPWGGTFTGLKVFTCDDGESGFTVRLLARFSGGGSEGTWTLADAWGDLAGLKGSGSLVGIPMSETAIDDVYSGRLR